MSQRALVVDAVDPPLGAAERVVVTGAGEAVLRGLGEIALDHPRAKLWLEGDDDLLSVAQRLQANLAHRATTSPAAGTLRLRPTTLAERAWGGDERVIAIAGAVARPQVFVAPAHATVAALVGAARPVSRAWVALWGGAHGTLVDRNDDVAALTADPRTHRLLLVLPTGHALAKRARVSLTTWLRRAQSACASCAICAPACPASIPVPELLRIVSNGRSRATTRLAAAVDCTACGACDLACPQSISPARIVADLARRMSGVAAPPRRKRVARALTEETATLRLGLRRYAHHRPESLTPFPS